MKKKLSYRLQAGISDLQAIEITEALRTTTASYSLEEMMITNTVGAGKAIVINYDSSVVDDETLFSLGTLVGTYEVQYITADLTRQIIGLTRA